MLTSLLDSRARKVSVAEQMHFCMPTTRGRTFLSFQGSPAPDPEPSDIWKSTLAKTPWWHCHPTIHATVQGPQRYSSLWKGEDPWTPSHSIDGNLGTRKDGKRGHGTPAMHPKAHASPSTLCDLFIGNRAEHGQTCRRLSSTSRQISFLARKAGGGILLISIIHCNAPNILRTRFPSPREDGLP